MLFWRNICRPRSYASQLIEGGIKVAEVDLLSQVLYLSVQHVHFCPIALPLVANWIRVLFKSWLHRENLEIQSTLIRVLDYPSIATIQCTYTVGQETNEKKNKKQN